MTLRMKPPAFDWHQTSSTTHFLGRANEVHDQLWATVVDLQNKVIPDCSFRDRFHVYARLDGIEPDDVIIDDNFGSAVRVHEYYSRAPFELHWLRYRPVGNPLIELPDFLSFGVRRLLNQVESRGGIRIDEDAQATWLATSLDPDVKSAMLKALGNNLSSGPIRLHGLFTR